MLSYKTMLIFFLKCLTIYLVLVLLIAPALSLDQTLAKGMCIVGNMTLADTAWKSKVQGNEQAMLVNINTVVDGDSSTVAVIIYKIKKPMLFCFLLLLSLLLALPYKRKRWYKTIGLGVLVMWVYIIIILKLYAIYGVNEVVNGVPIHASLFGQVFSNTVGHMTIIPVFIWALVAFRRSDFAQLRSSHLAKT